jgi:hypothetical protein
MPHDCKRRQVNVGDTVLIRALVESISEGETACNFTVKVIDQVPDTSEEYKPVISFNSRLVEKVQVPPAPPVGIPRPEQVPTLGRIVHFVLPDSSQNAGAHRAAIVTNPEPDTYPNLFVFIDDLMDPPVADNRSARSVEFDPTGTKPGTWHWPERV